MLQRLWTFILVTAWCLVPPATKNGSPRAGTAASVGSRGAVGVRTALAPLARFLSCPETGGDRNGELSLFVPHCPALAGPLLLFRLKRTGFSRCRALIRGGGILLSARR
ncbi:MULTISPECIES: hypothetical protein [Geobacter]|nr:MULTISPECIES: hypothetical protein [Geobacter]HMN02413.1 hypothetical protein [Geobacter anodireducens]